VSDELLKVERDGKIAVLVSPGFGAGWFTWGEEYPQCLFHPKLVEMVEAGDREKINGKLMETLGMKDFYTGGARDLEVVWMEKGTQFMIEEYDGSETLRYRGDDKLWTTA